MKEKTIFESSTKICFKGRVLSFTIQHREKKISRGMINTSSKKMKWNKVCHTLFNLLLSVFIKGFGR